MTASRIGNSVSNRFNSLIYSTNRLKNRAQTNLRHFFESAPKENKLSSSSKSTSTISSSDSGSEDRHELTKSKSTSVLKGVFYKWSLLALLGTLMAILSLLMDLVIQGLGDLQFDWLNLIRPKEEGLSKLTMTVGIWVLFGVIMIVISAIVVRIISQEAVGSGIPEIKTILRGVQLDGYLNFKTLVAVMVSLTFALSSGLPIGKAGPFVHASVIVANLVSRFIKSFDTGSVTGSLHNEMLAAGCAVGLACTFGSPIGGVLFSIEVTSVYFAVRNYWMNFFAASIATAVFRLLRVALSLDISVVSIYQTQLPQTCFFVEELPLFAMIGLFCGFASAGFIALHRKIVLFRRNNSTMKRIFDKHWLLYPIFVSTFISSLTYPEGFGNLLGGEHKFSVTARDLFLNCTWSADANSTYRCPEELINSWLDGGELDLFLVLSSFTVTFFVLTALAITLPIPAGVFGPAFAIGSGFGRLIGEFVAITYPNGVRNDGNPVWPAVYAVVGAASFCGGITHTISTAVIAYELTGQLVYILPVMIAVLISNAVCSYLQPSFYDSLIQLRSLPYLPSIPNSENFHGIKVDQFMVRNIRFLTPKSTFRELRDILTKTPLKAVPIVENPDRMILMGSCPRAKLMQALEQQIGSEARRAEARARVKLTQRINSVEHHLNIGGSQFSPLKYGSKPSLANFDNDNGSPFNKHAEFYFDDESSKSQFSLNSRSPTTPNGFSGINGRFTIGNLEENQSSYHGQSTLPLSTSMPNALGQNLHKLSSAKSDKFLNELNADLHGAEKQQWILERLSKAINLDNLAMDPTPFQLYNNTTLLKTHSMFSLLGLARAYVTNCGRLIGVVSLRDLRLAIENVNSGILTIDSLPVPIEEEQFEENKSEDTKLELPPKGRELPSSPKRKFLDDIHEDEKEEHSFNENTVVVDIEESPYENHTELANRTNFVLKRLEERENEIVKKPVIKKRKSF